MRDWPIAERLNDGRWLAPAAERNQAPILEVLARELPQTGRVLEIASGTGQHVVRFAQSLPSLSWQPSDPDAGFRGSILQWIDFAHLANVDPPLALDVRQLPWPIAAADAIVCINMVHVAPWAATPALFAGARQVLARDNLLFLYGPFRRGGQHTAPSNAKFDAGLRAHDPEWGLRDIEALTALASDTGFTLADVVAMPANNFSLIFRKRDAADG